VSHRRDLTASKTAVVEAAAAVSTLSLEHLLPTLRGALAGADEAELARARADVLLELVDDGLAVLLAGGSVRSGEALPIAPDRRRPAVEDPVAWDWTATQDAAPVLLSLTSEAASLLPRGPRWRLLGFDRTTDLLAIEHRMARPDPDEARRRLHLPPHDELLDSYPIPPEELDWWADQAGVPLPADRHEWFAEA